MKQNAASCVVAVAALKMAPAHAGTYLAGVLEYNN